MANKEVIISAGGITLTFKRVTEASISEEIESDSIKTFDETVTVPSEDAAFTVDISALEARDLDEYKKLKKILLWLKKEKGDITISEEHKTRDGGSFVDLNHLSGVVLSSNEVSYDAEDLTARDLSFTAETCDETVDGEPITIDEEGGEEATTE